MDHKREKEEKLFLKCLQSSSNPHSSHPPIKEAILKDRIEQPQQQPPTSQAGKRHGSSSQRPEKKKKSEGQAMKRKDLKRERETETEKVCVMRDR